MSSVHITTRAAGPEHLNEDAAGWLGEAVVLMDGAGMPPATRAGCRHSVRWFARTATDTFLDRLQDPRVSMREALAQTIRAVAALHDGECDLDAGSPSATVVAVRRCGDRFEHLVLCDSTLGIVTGSGTEIVTDRSLDRVRHPLDDELRALRERLDPVRDRRDPELVATVRRRDAAVRNRPGGFWCVGHRPEAADHALTGEIPVDEVKGFVLASDGAMRPAEVFGELTAEDLVTAYLKGGADRWLDHTRALETARGAENPWRKRHDDATVVVIREEAAAGCDAAPAAAE